LFAAAVDVQDSRLAALVRTLLQYMSRTIYRQKAFVKTLSMNFFDRTTTTS